MAVYGVNAYGSGHYGAEPLATATGALTLSSWSVAASVSEIESAASALTLSTWKVAGQESYETASAGLTLSTWIVAATAAEVFSAAVALTLSRWTVAGQESYETGSAALALSSWLLAGSVSELMAATAALTLSTWRVASQASYESASAPLTLSSWLVAATVSELMTAAAALTLSRWLFAAAENYETGSAALTLSGWLVAVAATIAGPIVSGAITLFEDTFTLTFSGAITLTEAVELIALAGQSFSGRIALVESSDVIALVGVTNRARGAIALVESSDTMALTGSAVQLGTIGLKEGSANAPLLHLVAPEAAPVLADLFNLATTITASRGAGGGGAWARIVPRQPGGEPLRTANLAAESYARVTLRRATGGDTVETTGRFESGPDGISIVAVWPDALPWVGLYYVYVEAGAQRCPTMGYVPVLVEA